MQVTVTGHHIPLSNSLRDFAKQKLGKLSQHSEQILHADVVLTHQSGRNKAEVKVGIPGHNLISHADGRDMYHILGLAIDKVDKQLVRVKEKRTTRRTQEVTINEEA
ncbi:ribosome hibernation-promoting factor, HPF/YfiA family [Piscirickettsia litoralis]|uniref:Ribosome hibernation promoting factor n=1 Tax=Piscirickettsia litoralis TaxID=1891921 RepID=A0ABX3A8Y8_9GAMM|nr:ribosome-associated translation inhibitor RaiA [Piscirickettsia litoralis]ODN43900.1 ribosomal subunit interface protein [Piscirickettsia litoralis]